MSWGTGKLGVAVDEPGRRLHLHTTSEPTPALSARLGCLSIILPAVAVALWLILGGDGDSGTQRAVNQIILTSVVVVVSLLFIRAIVFPPRQLVALEAERGGDIRIAIDLPGREEGRFLTRRADQLSSVDLSVKSGSSGRSETHYPLRLVFRDREGKSWVDRMVEVDGVNRDEEALDLLARLGAALDLGYYRVLARDPGKLELRATREADSESERLPRPAEGAAYDEDRVASGISLPDEVRSTFNPALPLPAGLGVLKWDPGQRVVIGRRNRTFSAALCMTLFALSAAAALAAWFPDATEAGRALIDAAGRWWDEVYNVGVEGGITFMRAAIGVVSAVGLIAALVIGQRLLDRSVIDLVRRRIVVHMGLRRSEIRIPEIRSLDLVKRSRTHQNPGSDGKSTTIHRSYRIEVTTDRGDPFPVLRFYSTTSHVKAEKMYERLYPLSVELAEIMGVPHRYEPDAED